MEKILIITPPEITLQGWGRGSPGFPNTVPSGEELEIREVYSRFNIEAEFFHPEIEQDIVHRLKNVDAGTLGIILNPDSLHTFKDEIISQLNDLKLPVVGVHRDITGRNGDRDDALHQLNPHPVVLFGFDDDLYYMAMVAILEISHQIKKKRKISRNFY